MPCFNESYQGEVVHVTDNSVTVIFCIDDDLVEQTYDASRFIGDLPQKGDCLEAIVIMSRIPTGSVKISEERKPRKNTVQLPRTF